jgi:hypothetical protein
VGTYRVRLHRPGKSDFAGGFEVQQYQLQKINLEVELPRTVYFRGEAISGKVVARYQYGTPLAGREIEVNLPDGRTLRGKTSEEGVFAFEFPTEGLAEEQVLTISAALPQDGVAAQARASLAIRAFRIALRSTRDVYLDGESFPLEVTTTDALGEPGGQSLTLTVLKRVEQAGRVVERHLHRPGNQEAPPGGRGHPHPFRLAGDRRDGARPGRHLDPHGLFWSQQADLADRRPLSDVQ